MKKGQTSVRGGIQDFLCPFTDMNITQGSNYGTHAGTMANDVASGIGGYKAPYYAPCDCKLIWSDPANGQGMWQSLNKVRFANGNIAYATFVTAHDNTFDAKVGQSVVKQGQQLGNMGDKFGNGGYADGVHCHIEIAQNKYMYPSINPNTKIRGVTVKDNICYVNLSEDFLTQTTNVAPDVTIYSITNALVELENVNKVQISIEGNNAVVFRDTYELTTLFERNLDILKPVEEE